MNHARSILPGPRRTVGLSLVLVALLVAGCSLLPMIGCACTTPVPRNAGLLSVYNGTPIKLSLAVNGRVIQTVEPKSRLDPIYITDLSTLPWTVEARLPSGRTLLSMVATANTIWQTDSNGDLVRRNPTSAARVDLSCGRLDIWSGQPVLGPMNGPGTPGDCIP